MNLHGSKGHNFDLHLHKCLKNEEFSEKQNYFTEEDPKDQLVSSLEKA